jgi:hypothetical protein
MESEIILPGRGNIESNLPDRICAIMAVLFFSFWGVEVRIVMKSLPLGGGLTLLVLLPNLVFVFFPPLSSAVEMTPLSGRGVRMMGIFERVGQAGCFLLPFFYRLRVVGWKDGLAVGVMAVCLAGYYAGWVRYLVRGRHEALLYQSMFAIPLPMAVFPVTYFFTAGVLFDSIWLGLAALVLGVGHISVSALNARRIVPTER